MTVFSSGERLRAPEVMDDPSLEAEEHLAALAGLARLNRLSRSAETLWRPLAEVARRNPQRHLRVLDIATGSGDVAQRLASLAGRAGIPLEIHGIDISPRAIALARARASRSGLDRAPATSLSFETRDALADPLPAGFDVVISSLFLHHLGHPEAVQLLARSAEAAQQVLLVSDLARSARGLALAALASRILTRSRVVRADAVRSARAAFTVKEARMLAEEAGLKNAAVVHRWPCRWLLRWRRP